MVQKHPDLGGGGGESEGVLKRWGWGGRGLKNTPLGGKIGKVGKKKLKFEKILFFFGKF